MEGVVDSRSELMLDSKTKCVPVLRPGMGGRYLESRGGSDGRGGVTIGEAVGDAGITG